MRTMPRLAACTFAAVLAAVACLAARPAAAQAPMPLPQTWTGEVLPSAGLQPGLTAEQLELRVSQLSSDAEIAGLLEKLRIGGQVGLRNAMRGLAGKGFLRFGKLAGVDVTVIRVFDREDGHRVLRLYCDFPIRLFDQSVSRFVTDEHPFGFIELEVDSSGTGGTGKLVAAASLGLGEDGLKIEAAATPVLTVLDVTSNRPPAPPAPR